ncbi:hypothetical protein Daus18300_007395 [Diaporthe australafricana]|uniref:Uncharacterized protein n=1 Tax=Diaporthe australafricana TaxID=127596 RepID=A0ABR3WN95_9PEZI
MRFFAIASLLTLAVALPAVAPSEQSNAVARCGDALADVTARADASSQFVDRAINPFDQTYSWPEESVTGGGLSAQFQATNLGDSNYSFTFWNTGPLNGGDLSYRVSYGGKELAKKVLSPRGTVTVTVPKTGDNFNIYIEDA